MASTLDVADTGTAGNVMTRYVIRAPLLHRHQDRIGQPPSGESVRLKDGSLVLVRPVQTTDVPLMIDGFARLSPNSRRMRFLIGKSALTARELKYFTDIDHRDHEALGAVDAVSGRGVGVARYIRDADDVHCAEVAITVVDAWQGRGLGSALMARLAWRAQNEGIRRFSALIAADNVAVVTLLRRMDADVELVSYDTDTAKYEISLRCRQPCGPPQDSVAGQPHRADRRPAPPRTWLGRPQLDHQPRHDAAATQHACGTTAAFPDGASQREPVRCGESPRCPTALEIRHQEPGHGVGEMPVALARGPSAPTEPEVLLTRPW